MFNYEPWQEEMIYTHDCESQARHCDYCNDLCWGPMYEFTDDAGNVTMVCEDCLYDFIKEQTPLFARDFVFSDEEITAEFLREWFRGMTDTEQTDILKKAFFENELHEDKALEFFASEHSYFRDYIFDQLGGREV